MPLNEWTVPVAFRAASATLLTYIFEMVNLVSAEIPYTIIQKICALTLVK